jgi:pyruvate formate lyase activating enzyme
MRPLNRRQFICSGLAVLSAGSPALAFSPFSRNPKSPTAVKSIRGRIFKNDAPDELWEFAHEGFLYKKLNHQKVVCGICPNHCMLSPGDRSVCRSKINKDGVLYTLTYGNPCAVHLDPIEKKPLYHFKPRSKTFSLATTGCNFRCLNCQNWEISQAKPEEVRFKRLFPAEAVSLAKKIKAESIAYTYSEATTFFEYMMDIARPAHNHGLSNLWITNGYINRKPLMELCRVLDAANVNLKSFSDSLYRRLNGGRLNPVLETLKTLHAQKIHLEITHLVVPGFVDDEDMLKAMCAWILKHLGPDYPLHFLRFFPHYKLDRLPPTPVSTLVRFRELAISEGLHYVYLGNVPYHEGNNTYCHHCGKRLIQRKGYFIPQYNLNGNRCRFCGGQIPGVWEEGSSETGKSNPSPAVSERHRQPVLHSAA